MNSALLSDDAGVTALLLFNRRQPTHHVLAAQLAQCVVANVAETSMPALIFPFIMPDPKTYTVGNIDLQYIQVILTLVNLDESVLAILDSEYPCLNPHCTSPFIQLA
jgi:hypothetical protein